jgi:hypothetical protein
MQKYGFFEYAPNNLEEKYSKNMFYNILLELCSDFTHILKQIDQT